MQVNNHNLKQQQYNNNNGSECSIVVSDLMFELHTTWCAIFRIPVKEWLWLFVIFFTFFVLHTL